MKTQPKNSATILEIQGKGVAMKLPDDLQERDIELRVTQFPSGCRDFFLVQRDEDGKPQSLSPLELLVLDRAADLIEQESFPPKALNLALCRLLAPSVRTERVGRHLVVEEWTESKVKGETLGDETRSYFAQELSRAQADKWSLVTSGQEAPEGNLAALMWEAVTHLPALPARFEDPDLGKFGKALYFHLVPEGHGRAEFAGWREINEKIEQCRTNDFAPLGLPFSPTQLRKLFRKYMAVMVRWTSKMTGQLALGVINAKLGEASPLTERELALLNLRYGDSAIFGKINVGFLLDCGPLFTEFFNDIGRSIANGAKNAESTLAANELLKFVYLHRNYLRFRTHARRDKKAYRRACFFDSKGTRQRRIEDNEDFAGRDREPVKEAAVLEEMVLLEEKILPQLERHKPHYAELLRLLIGHGGNFDAAAKDAGLSTRKFKRRLRETVFPTAKRIARNSGMFGLLDD